VPHKGSCYRYSLLFASVTKLISVKNHTPKVTNANNELKQAALSLTLDTTLLNRNVMTNAKIIFDEYKSRITAHPPEEANQIAFTILNTYYRISRLDIYKGVEIDERFLPADIIDRVNAHEPIQYVLGQTNFCDVFIRVNPHVLIPRPETEELVLHAIKYKPKTVLDLGTGSGCIPIAIAHACPQAQVYGVDVSEEALNVARLNAYLNEQKVEFLNKDILNFEWETDTTFDLIISNPPYVKASEIKEMDPHVTDHEPHLALFVPDCDPLVFYKKIAVVGEKYLQKGGKIMVEINSALGKETLALFQTPTYSNAVLEKDFYGKDRFVFAERN
jgi:release factor glutamine methyltransferase